MVSLLDSVHEHLTPTFIHEVSRWLGENEQATANALGAWSAAILAGTANYADHVKAIQRIYDHLGHFPPDIMEKPHTLLRHGNLAHNDPKDVAGHLMAQLFGPKTEALINSIAAFSGCSTKSASELLGVAAPIVLSILGKRVQASAMTVAGLSNLLRADQSRILTAVPGGLLPILDLRQTSTALQEEPKPATGFNWVGALAALAALGGVLFWVLRMYSR